MVRRENGTTRIMALDSHDAKTSHVMMRVIFGQQILARVPLVAHIRQQPESEPSGKLSDRHFLKLLQIGLRKHRFCTNTKPALSGSCASFDGQISMSPSNFSFSRSHDTTDASDSA
ncbi:MAG: hypothetical protein ACK542_04825 [Burkholderiales bacterium]